MIISVGKEKVEIPTLLIHVKKFFGLTDTRYLTDLPKVLSVVLV